MTELILDSLRRRMRAMHSLWEDAIATMDLDQVNHVEREPVLPIAFSIFHLVQIEDGSATMLGAGPMVYDESWAPRMGLAIADHGKHKTVDEMVGQRIGDYDAFKDYMQLVFEKTESWLATLEPRKRTVLVAAVLAAVVLVVWFGRSKPSSIRLQAGPSQAARAAPAAAPSPSPAALMVDVAGLVRRMANWDL